MLCFIKYVFSLKFIVIAFAFSSFNLGFTSIISSQITTESSIILAKYFSFLKLHGKVMQVWSFLQIWSFLHSHQHVSLFHFPFELHFLPLNLHSHLHDIYFVKLFDTYLRHIIFKTCISKCSVLLGTHTLKDK